VPTNPSHIFLDDVRARGGEVARNVSASLLDLGDGVLCLEFHSKMNALDDQIFPLYQQALEWLDADRYDALVVGNEGAPAGIAPAFCAGANLLMVLMFAMQGDWAGLEGAIRGMQDGLMAAKHHRKPVVTAPHGLALGGGVEVTMHSAATVAGAELYAGLVELGVGVIPAGGGCKEMLARFLGDQPPGVVFDSNPFVQEAFKNIATAKVSGSVREAQAMGYIRPHDKVVMDPSRLLWEAKRTALGLVAGGWEPRERTSFKLPGASGRAAIEAYLFQMHQGGFVTDHDVTVAKKLAYVLTGGDCAGGAVRTEQDILDLEREAFLSLCGTAETQARIQHMLQTGKPLRN
jgi:3-hydroxyacyl-CoA dehydrogenase